MATGDFNLIGNPDGISAIVENQLAITNSYIVSLAGLSSSLTPPVIVPVFPTGPTAPPQVVASPPVLQSIIWTAPALPAAFNETLDVSDVMPAPFDDAPPVLSFGAAPAAFSGVEPDAPGVDFTYVDPTLDVQLPAPPELLTLNIVPFDGINLPTIDPDAVPVLTAVAPSIREYVPGTQYTSNLLTNLKSYLNDVMLNGGTGLNPDVENAIWDRGREREARSRADALKELDKMEEMGFALAPGVYVDARLKIATESDMTNRGLSREIMIKQAELALDTTQKSLAAATELEGKSMDYSNAVEQRLFESTKYATEAGIAIYNAQVQAYGAYVEAYKTKIAIYEAQVRAELARVDAYKATIEAEQVKATINTALVEQYKVAVDAALSNIEVYKARIAGIQTKAEIEKTKIEAYGEQIRAFVGKINAYTAGVEGFRASLEAESTKQKVYQGQVEAYTARVEAAAKTADIRIAAFKGRLEANTTLWDGYKATIAGEASKAQAISSVNQSISAEYQSQVSAITSYNEVQTKQWQAAIDQAQRVVDIGINTAKANAELYMTTRSLALDAAKTAGQVSAQISSAALNAINWSSSISRSYGESDSTSQSFSTSNSTSDSTSNNTNQNYSFSN